LLQLIGKCAQLRAVVCPPAAAPLDTGVVSQQPGNSSSSSSSSNRDSEHDAAQRVLQVRQEVVCVGAACIVAPAAC
jgi:hypothetical protein